MSSGSFKIISLTNYFLASQVYVYIYIYANIYKQDLTLYNPLGVFAFKNSTKQTS